MRLTQVKTAGHRSELDGNTLVRATAVIEVTPAHVDLRGRDSRPIEHERLVRDSGVYASSRSTPRNALAQASASSSPGTRPAVASRYTACPVCGSAAELNTTMLTSGRTPMFREWCAFGDDNQ